MISGGKADREEPERTKYRATNLIFYAIFFVVCFGTVRTGIGKLEVCPLPGMHPIAEFSHETPHNIVGIIDFDIQKPNVLRLHFLNGILNQSSCQTLAAVILLDAEHEFGTLRSKIWPQLGGYTKNAVTYAPTTSAGSTASFRQCALIPPSSIA